MDLYYLPLSVYSHKVLMACYEKAIDVNLVKVNLFDANARGEYKALYPLAKLPGLVTDDGEFMGESSIIVEWLDTHFEGERLIPLSSADALAVRKWDRLVDQYMIANGSILFFQSIKPEAQQDQGRIVEARERMTAAYQLLDTHLASRGDGANYIVGDSLSLADITALVALSATGAMVSFEDFPNVTAYFEQHKDRETLVKARDGFLEAASRLMNQPK